MTLKELSDNMFKSGDFCKCEMCDYHRRPTPKDERKGLDWLIDTIRKYWSFDEHQQHTHSWHSREDCIEEIRKHFFHQGKVKVPVKVHEKTIERIIKKDATWEMDNVPYVLTSKLTLKTDNVIWVTEANIKYITKVCTQAIEEVINLKQSYKSANGGRDEF